MNALYIEETAMEDTPWQFIVGNWYQDNAWWLVLSAMLLAVVAWFIGQGIVYEYRHRKTRQSPYPSDKEKPKELR